ncbi:MAG: GNAT family N-acetyltransferase [Sciscionella sp.]
MRIDHVVTYLAMTTPEQLRPIPHVEGVSLERIPATADVLAETRACVGAPFRWSSAEWARRRFQENVRHWLIRIDGSIAGVATLLMDVREGVEIDTFGLVPECIGRGYGGYALTLTIEQAWAFAPAEPSSVRRVWLHTSSTDHPHALRNYERRGFHRTHREKRTHKPD